MIKIYKILLGVILCFLFFGCDKKQEFGNVHFDRDECKYCKMVVSDNKFSIDVVAEGQNHYFDDIGCFVNFIVKNNKLNWLNEAKIYINDAKSGEFIDAKTAYFYYGFNSPMAFGWGAFKAQLDGKNSFSFDEVVKKIEENIKTNRHTHSH